jgi:hypothetical protein
MEKSRKCIAVIIPTVVRCTPRVLIWRLIVVFTQGKNHFAVPGKDAIGLFVVLMSWHGIIVDTQAKNHFNADFVIKLSHGLTIWTCTCWNTKVQSRHYLTNQLRSVMSTLMINQIITLLQLNNLILQYFSLFILVLLYFCTDNISCDFFCYFHFDQSVF